MSNLIVSIPHSGETVPPEANWLKVLPEEILMCDVDRFVDHLYRPALETHNIPHVITQWHRYSGDLNRLPHDVDASTVMGSPNPAGRYSRGFLWAVTTTGYPLMKEPVSPQIFKTLVEKYFEPFHRELKEKALKFRKPLYHLDAHSMPSTGTKEHRDPGEKRADFVISDQLGKSCRPEFLEMVVQAYEKEGFQIKVNWPYIGGRITEMYGQPSAGHHTVQVEMNRALYMNETTRQLVPEKAKQIQGALTQTLGFILNKLSTSPFV